MASAFIGEPHGARSLHRDQHSALDPTPTRVQIEQTSRNDVVTKGEIEGELAAEGNPPEHEVHGQREIGQKGRKLVPQGLHTPLLPADRDQSTRDIACDPPEAPGFGRTLHRQVSISTYPLQTPFDLSESQHEHAPVRLLPTSHHI